jgi:flagellar basal-body rod modification protein FlgD
MAIAGIDTIKTNDSALLSTGGDSVLGRDEFLNLLITQLRYQDPLNPMESTEFTAQLAQFSSLEQLGNINENLEYLQMYQASSNNSQAVGFIGKNIEASGDSISLANGVSADMHFELAADTRDIFINIYDSYGNFVKTLEAGSLSAGGHSSEWDGTDHNGNKLPDGVYAFEILAVDENGEMVDATTYTTGKVTGVTFKDGITYLLAGDQKIPMGNVIKVTGD